MAQRTEKEETEIKVPEALTLCANNCGFKGSPATANMCQKCFNAVLNPHKFSAAAESPRSSAAARSPDRSEAAPDLSQSPQPAAAAAGIGRDPADDRAPAEATASQRKEINRCSGCRRKVGLTGVRCRCGELFCGEHRYTDRHDCSYDYKSAGRVAIARENPVVKAAKIIKV